MAAGDEPPSEHNPSVPRCHICGTTEDLMEQYLPSASGPGSTFYVCALDVYLPPDPETAPAIVDEILARKGKR